MTSPQKTPLEGYVVVDLATMVAAPYCASILGEFGADVIKVEMPGRGDMLRSFGAISGTGSSFNWLSEARNKKSITLDLRKPDGAALARRLLERADVVTENFRPGTLEKWGLGYEALKAVKSDLVLVSVSAYGQFGPHKDRPGYARIAHGFSGLAHLSGEPDGPPAVPGASALGDYVAGVYAALGALLALTARDRFGIGQQVDVSLYEGMFRMLDDLVPIYAKYGVVRDRLGADSTSAVPHSNYRTKDQRWVSIACSNDRMFARLASAMGRLDLLEPGRFALVTDRIAHRSEVNRVVADWVETWTSDEVIEHGLAADVPIGPINNIADLFEDEHVRERGNLVSVDAPGEGEVVVPNVVPRLTETPGHVNTLGPTLGQHNKEVYCDWLGLSTRELDDLREREII
jgi:crotonobetainyl-CoA:carnitine CoA-transferase CaiB-like acyl-CoA transferase